MPATVDASMLNEVFKLMIYCVVKACCYNLLLKYSCKIGLLQVYFPGIYRYWATAKMLDKATIVLPLIEVKCIVERLSSFLTFPYISPLFKLFPFSSFFLCSSHLPSTRNLFEFNSHFCTRQFSRRRHLSEKVNCSVMYIVWFHFDLASL